MRRFVCGWAASRRLVTALFVLLAACTTNPVTGEAEFTPFLSAEEEARLGAQEHPRILEAFGGVYEDPALQAYVTAVGQRLVTHSELPDNMDYLFTILDSPIVNAMALPGGYVYVTRGLLAYVNSEAELAGVMAHEIGHVVARHTAKRYNRSIFTQLGATILGALAGSQQVADLANVGGQFYLLSYSRGQEYEADLLGVRYMAQAGYDPIAQADFLATLEALDELQSRIEGRQVTPVEFFSTHPNTAKRVAEALEAARAQGMQVTAAERARERYLEAVDGLVFGDSPEQGFVRGRDFVHPDLGFAFTVPEGFRLQNTPGAVLATGPEESLIQVDAAPAIRGLPIELYLRDRWAAGAALENLERITINGMPAATATTGLRTRSGPMLARLVAIQFSDRHIFRLVMLTPPGLADDLSVPLRRFTYSFRKLSPEEARAIKPLRIEVVTVQPGDTVEELARRLPFEDFQVERFRVLNGYDIGQLTPGRKVKLIAE